MTRVIFRGRALTLMLLCAEAVAAATPPTLTTLDTFATYYAFGAFVQGTDGNFYAPGTPYSAESQIVQITLQGALTPIYTYCSLPDCVDGQNANGFLLGADGNFYGTTPTGGTYNHGTIFKLTEAGILKTLYSFDGKHAGTPVGLIQASSGDFVGTAAMGGAYGSGAIFKLTAAGVLTILHSFCAQTNCADGGAPYGTLHQAENGNFYGTTASGGIASSCSSCGTVYQITPEGSYSVLHAFGGADGDEPQAGVTEGTDGAFYGTTKFGGAYSYGTIYKVTTTGAFTTLYSFSSGTAEIGEPVCQLVQAANGGFYGTTPGFTYLGSSIFSITPGGLFASVYSFNTYTQGNAFVSPMQHTNGMFYGTTSFTLYRLSVGLPPFVKTVPVAGHVGASVIILGTNLTGATGVTFNGTPALFNVVSATEITATVPTGATTGKLQVMFPSGPLSNLGRFVVTP